MPQDLLIQAYREEAALYRKAGKESAAIKLERVADRMQRLMDIYSKKENSNGDRTR